MEKVRPCRQSGFPDQRKRDSRLPFRKAVLARGDLTDTEWRIIEGLLPTERGRKSRPSHDNRQYLNGMLHVLRVGCAWRDMHERYGKWNSVHVRFRRWA
jgi:transposase